MTVKLLTEYHLEFLSLQLQRLVRVYTCQNATLLEISCTGLNIISGQIHHLTLSMLGNYSCLLNFFQN